MTSLKCLNSGVESNGAAFILSPSGYGFASRVPGAFGKEVVSSITPIFASQLFVSDAASNDLLHDGCKSLRVRSLAIVITKRLFVDVAKQMEGFQANVGSDGVIDDGVLIVSFQSIIGF